MPHNPLKPLSSLPGISESERLRFANLALQLQSQQPPPIVQIQGQVISEPWDPTLAGKRFLSFW